jgi:ectoine hydroxylase-related dioxygenase (phytanoyl-CoA dioxygenase family)
MTSLQPTPHPEARLAAEKSHLDSEGYVVLKQVLSPEKVQALKQRLDLLYAQEGPRAGEFGWGLIRTRYLQGSRVKLRLLDAAYRLLEFTLFRIVRWFPTTQQFLRSYRSAPYDYSTSTPWRREFRQMVVCAVEKLDEPSDWRLCDLVNKGEVFDEVYTHPRVLPLVEHLLGDDFKLSSLNVRSPKQGGPMQGMHIDFPFRVRAGKYYACNVLFALDDMDAENGATRVIPGTHTSGKMPQDEMDDIRADHPDQIVVEAKAGDALLVNGHVWHGGTVNSSGRRRTLIQCYYAHSAHAPQQYQELQLRDEVRARLSPRALALLNAD